MSIAKRSAILQQFEKNTDWRSLIEENAYNYIEYDKLFRSHQFDEADRKFKNILPDYFRVIHLINLHRIQIGLLPDFSLSRYDIGIFLVGYTPMPIVLSLAEIKPMEVVLITSEDTRDETTLIKESIEILAPDYFRKLSPDKWEEIVLSDISDPARVYGEIDPIIKKYTKHESAKRIAIDITGGKKTMVAGSFMASAWSKTCDIFYVDFEEYERDMRSPVYNTEYLAILPNPSEIYSIADWERMKSLFNRFQFEQVIEEAKRIEGNINIHKIYFSKEALFEIQKVKKISEGYKFWDDYRYHRAYDILNPHEQLRILGAIQDYYQDRLEHHIRSGLPKYPGANNKAIMDTRQKIWENKDWLSHYIIDRFCNAIRRKSQQHVQGAFLRFITLTEFILILYAEKTFNANQISNFVSGKHVVFRKLCNFLKRNPRQPVIDNINIDELIKLLDMRNQAILIHSIRIFDEMDLGLAENIAGKAIQNVLSIKGVNLSQTSEIEKALKFPLFKDIIS